MSNLDQSFWQKLTSVYVNPSEDEEQEAELKISEQEKARRLSKVHEVAARMPTKLRSMYRAALKYGDDFVRIGKALGISRRAAERRHENAVKWFQAELAKEKVVLSIGALIPLLIAGPFADAAESHLQGLFAETPELVDGLALPGESLMLPTEVGLVGKASGSVWASAKTWVMVAAIGVVVGVPVTMTLGVWEQAIVPIPTAVSATPAIITPTPKPVPLPGGFPRNPSPGQIHTVRVESIGLAIDYCWSPGDGSAVRGVWMERTEHTQLTWKLIQFVVNGMANPSAFQGDSLPVESVSAHEVEAYCKRFMEITGIPVRLPTLEEWTRAAAAGLKSPEDMPDETELKQRAWYQGNSGQTTHPVGTRDANSLNLFDIFGNVFELVRDGEEYRICGACWCYEAIWCRTGYTDNFAPDRKESGTGFRLVYEPPSEPETK